MILQLELEIGTRILQVLRRRLVYLISIEHCPSYHKKLALFQDISIHNIFQEIAPTKSSFCQDLVLRLFSSNLTHY